MSKILQWAILFAICSILVTVNKQLINIDQRLAVIAARLRPESQEMAKADSWGGIVPNLDDKPLDAKLDGQMVCSAYCSCRKCCGEFADGITAAGHLIRPGDRFAAAPPGIPFGTMILVPGYNGGRPVPVLDRGGAIAGNKLDLYFDTHEEALAWGIKKLKVQVKK